LIPTLILETTNVAFKDTIIYDLLIALITGVLSCVLFFLALRVFKPCIKTCNIICKEVDHDENGTEIVKYYFKFINMTWADIENVSINLLLLEDYINGSGKNFRGKELKLKRSEFKNIPGRGRRNKDIHNNCLQIRIEEDLETIWDGKKEWMELQIDCTHSKSGRRLVHIQKYTHPRKTIKNGSFDSGENFNVIE